MCLLVHITKLIDVILYLFQYLIEMQRNCNYRPRKNGRLCFHRCVSVNRSGGTPVSGSFPGLWSQVLYKGGGRAGATPILAGGAPVVAGDKTGVPAACTRLEYRHQDRVPLDKTDRTGYSPQPGQGTPSQDRTGILPPLLGYPTGLSC